MLTPLNAFEFSLHMQSIRIVVYCWLIIHLSVVNSAHLIVYSVINICCGCFLLQCVQCEVTNTTNTWH